MPLTIVCQACRTVLYNGDFSVLTVLDEFSKKIPARCPNCGRATPSSLKEATALKVWLLGLHPVQPEERRSYGASHGRCPSPSGEPLLDFAKLKVGDKFDLEKIRRESR